MENKLPKNMKQSADAVFMSQHTEKKPKICMYTPFRHYVTSDQNKDFHAFGKKNVGTWLLYIVPSYVAVKTNKKTNEQTNKKDRKTKNKVI